jgi:hypothetical protein
MWRCKTRNGLHVETDVREVNVTASLFLYNYFILCLFKHALSCSDDILFKY